MQAGAELPWETSPTRPGCGSAWLASAPASWCFSVVSDCWRRLGATGCQAEARRSTRVGWPRGEGLCSVAQGSLSNAMKGGRGCARIMYVCGATRAQEATICWMCSWSARNPWPFA
ncbi:hypothetical protein B0T11DRAFT_315749, partial [Plectosphaerella cucumerina]